MSDSIHVAGAILRRKQVEKVVGLSRTTIYQRIKDGTFPRPVSLGGRMVGWRASDIETFLVNPAGYRVAASPFDRAHDDD